MRRIPGAEGGSRKGQATALFPFIGGKGHLVAIVVHAADEGRHKGGRPQQVHHEGRTSSVGKTKVQKVIRRNGRGLQGRTRGRTQGSSRASSATTLLTKGSGRNVSTAGPAVRTATRGESGGIRGIAQNVNLDSHIGTESQTRLT